MEQKNVFKKLVATLLLACILMVCTTALRGTYTSSEGLIGPNFTFMKDNKAEVSAFGIDAEGKYLIEEGKNTIPFNMLGLSYDGVKNFEKEVALSLLTAQSF